MSFIGRQRELEELRTLFSTVQRGTRADKGIAVLLRGRRRVGKSRLVTEFIEQAHAPHVYFQAARHAPAQQELTDLLHAVTHSSVPDTTLAQDSNPQTLTAALTLLATTLPDDTPSIVVLDEAPWLLENFPGGAGEVQRVWDRALSRKPVLLLLLGSDLSAMEQLNAPDQPFHGRATEMVLHPLNPAEVATMTGTHGSEAFDAHLITGGQPLVAQEWEKGMSVNDFLTTSYQRPTSALVVSGTRVLHGEISSTSTDHDVLLAVGAQGERTFTAIQRAGADGGFPSATLSQSLHRLTGRRLLAVDEPLSTRTTSKLRRFRIADPSLRYWLAFVQTSLPDIDRGRPNLALARHQQNYSSWRGRAIEPLIREALSRLLPNDDWPHVREIGGWWPRSNTPEIDIIGTDSRPASHIMFAGTIKWRDDQPLTARDARSLSAAVTAVPGATSETPLVGVTAGHAETDADFARIWNAEELLTAWTG
ncbi:ATP-binding protein [Nesterenkonia populi]